MNSDLGHTMDIELGTCAEATHPVVMDGVGGALSESEQSSRLREAQDPLGRFVVGTVRSWADLLALESEWRTLEARLPALPFVSFDWNVAWWKHLNERKRVVVDELAVKTFRSASGELCAVAPMMRTCRPGVGPIRVRQLQFFGADPNITEIRGMAAPDELREGVYAALLDHLQSDKDSWEWLDMSGLPSSPASVGAMVQRFPGTRWLQDIPSYYLPLPPTWAEFKTQLSRNIKESIRKCFNAPKRDGVIISLTVARTGSEVTAAVERFFCLHQMRSELRDTIQHRNVFAAESARQFLREVCQRFAARSALRIFQLTISGEVVATRIGFIVGDGLYLYYSGYDPAFAKYSVMTTVLAEAIRYAIGEGIRTVNLSTGKDVAKERWGPQCVTYRNPQVVSPSLLGQSAHRTYSILRDSLESFPAAARLRALLSRSS